MMSSLVLFAFLALVVLAIYTPALLQHISYRKASKNLECEVEQLPALYSKCCLVINDCLGVGPDPNSDTTFEQASENQEIAMDAIAKVIDDLEA